jgi:hypothetical protein
VPADADLEALLRSASPETCAVLRDVLRPLLTEGADALLTLAKARSETPIQVACAFATCSLQKKVAGHFEDQEIIALAQADRALIARKSKRRMVLGDVRQAREIRRDNATKFRFFRP